MSDGDINNCIEEAAKAGLRWTILHIPSGTDGIASRLVEAEYDVIVHRGYDEYAELEVSW